MTKLKDIAKDLKVGDVYWVRQEIVSIDPTDGVNGRYFYTKKSFGNSLLEAEVYGDNDVVLGDIDESGAMTKIVKEKEIDIQDMLDNEKSKGKVEAYEKILFNKKITIE